MSLFCQDCISFSGCDFLANRIALVKWRATEGIRAIVVVLHETQAKPFEFPVCHVLTQNRKLSASVRSKARVIVTQWCKLVFFGKEALAHWVQDVDETETLRPWLVVFLVDADAL